MWQDEKVQNTPRKKTIELDEKLTDSIQKSMFGGLRADGKNSLANTKKIMMGVKSLWWDSTGDFLHS